MLAERGDEQMVVGGIQKYTIGCNWKFAADNVWDFYHTVTHVSFRTYSSHDLEAAFSLGQEDGI